MIPLDEVQLFATNRPAPAPYPPTAKARARARLIAAATESVPSRGPLPRAGRRVALVGALGVAAALGMMVVQTAQIPGRSSLVQPASAAAAVLNRAAQTAQTHPDRAPRGNQFIYYEDTWRTGPPDGHGPWKIHRFKHWRSVDGTRNDISLETGGDKGADPYFMPAWFSSAGGYSWLATLPTDPDRLIEYWRHADPGPQAEDSEVAWKLHQLLLEPLLPPALRPAAYHALAKLPGISVIPDAVDAAGRHGIGLVFTDKHDGVVRAQSTAILDPKTYSVLGEKEWHATFTPQPAPGSQIDTSWTAVEHVRIVDQAPPPPAPGNSPVPSPRHS